MNNLVLSQQNILNFGKEGIGQVRIIEQNGDIRFVPKDVYDILGLSDKVKSTLTPVEEYCLFPELVNWNKIEKIKKKILKEENLEIPKRKIIYIQKNALLNEFNIAATILSESMKNRAEYRIN